MTTACRFDNSVYPGLCASHLEETGKDHSASLCDEGLRMKEQEIAALKADLRAAGLFLSGLDDHERPELCASCRVELDELLAKPGVAKVMEASDG